MYNKEGARESAICRRRKGVDMYEKKQLMLDCFKGRSREKGMILWVAFGVR